MLIEEIKRGHLAARKTGDKVKATLLTTVIGEANTLAKNTGVEQLGDQDVLALITKFLKGINETLAVIDPNTSVDFLSEKYILESYMPKQLNKDELTIEVKQIIDALKSKTNSTIQMGMVMGALKLGYSGQYDGKMASLVVKECLNAISDSE